MIVIISYVLKKLNQLNCKQIIPMRNIYLALVLLITSVLQVNKNIKIYVRENLHKVKSIDPQDTNFEDLEAIGNAIGDAKIVLMGEQCHGDGATFAAKSRLINICMKKRALLYWLLKPIFSL